MFNQYKYAKFLAVSLLVFFSVSCTTQKLFEATDTQIHNDSSQKSDKPLTIASNVNEIAPISKGNSLPRFSVLDPYSKARVFSSETLTQPMVIITYRGGWCPYCNVHLQELRKVLPKLDTMGVETVFLSGDRPEILISSLKEKTQKEISDFPYKIYSDAQLEAASALGVAFYANDVKMDLLTFIKDTKGSSLERYSALSVPSVFIVDADGIIQYVYFNPEYKERLSANELLHEVENILQ